MKNILSITNVLRFSEYSTVSNINNENGPLVLKRFYFEVMAKKKEFMPTSIFRGCVQQQISLAGLGFLFI